MTASVPLRVGRFYYGDADRRRFCAAGRGVPEGRPRLKNLLSYNNAMKRLLLMSLLTLALAGCTRHRAVPDPAITKELVVATRNGPASYFVDASGEIKGYEHDMVEHFARAQGWQVRWLQAANPDDLFAAVKSDQVNFAAAALSEEQVKHAGLIPGPTLFETQVVVVTREGGPRISTFADLSGKKIGILADNGFGELLRRLSQGRPGFTWQPVRDVWPEELLARLDEGDFDAVVLTRLDFNLARNFYPDLQATLVLQPHWKMVWALPPNAPLRFVTALDDFLAQAAADGTENRIYERYYGHVVRLAPEDITGFLLRRMQTLPRFIPSFERAQIRTDIDWRLLAAIGYQESQWDPLATSPTGVRGLMMLTAETADRMKVADRLDPLQSILGGARYLELLKDSLPKRIPEPDRTWFALAAYNQGIAHLEDARVLTQKRGGNPDSWADVKKALPLLANPKYYRLTKYGYARGGEALNFVDSVRNYYDILAKLEPPYQTGYSLGKLKLSERRFQNDMAARGRGAASLAAAASPGPRRVERGAITLHP